MIDCIRPYDPGTGGVISRMRATGIRHMPVRGADGRPVGIVSARDVLTVITDEPR